MAAAPVAKKLKDKRQLKTLEEIFKKVKITYIWLLMVFPQIIFPLYIEVDKDSKGKISLTEYFEIFEVHGIVVNKTETSRVIRLVGENGSLNKEKFVKIVRGSDFFKRSFDKIGGEVTEVSLIRNGQKE